MGAHRLAACSVGLNFCNKSGLSPTERFNAFIYSATFLREHFYYFDLQLPESGKDLSISEKRIVMDTGNYWEQFLDGCNAFERERLYVLVSGPDLHGKADKLKPLGRVEWSLILDFDPDTQVDGMYKHLEEEIEGRRSLHLMTSDDQISINPNRATYWYAANGLRGRDNTLPKGNNWLSWKQKYDLPLATLFQDLAKSSGELPVSLIVLWNEPIFIQKICDLATTALSDRLEIIREPPTRTTV